MAYYQPQQPFYNPRIPFTGQIQRGLTDGKTVTVSGRVLRGANRELRSFMYRHKTVPKLFTGGRPVTGSAISMFHVNLQCGSRPDANIALHFNPRFDSFFEYIVTNSKQNNTWGSEERIEKSLFDMETPFTLQILVTSHAYKISVNGVHVKDYNHRIPFNMVDTIVVDGKVEVNTIHFQDAVGFVPAQPGFQPQFAFPPGYGSPAFPAPASYSLPYKTIIRGGLQPGKTISIQGVVHPQASRFHINLRHRSGIALHYNPRFDENVVVRNTQTVEQWGSEDRSGEMPFQRGQTFQMIISCNPHHYNVFVNGSQVHTYNHRFSKLGEIDVLEVSGDLSLLAVIV